MGLDARREISLAGRAAALLSALMVIAAFCYVHVAAGHGVGRMWDLLLAGRMLGTDLMDVLLRAGIVLLLAAPFCPRGWQHATLSAGGLLCLSGVWCTAFDGSEADFLVLYSSLPLAGAAFFHLLVVGTLLASASSSGPAGS